MDVHVSEDADRNPTGKLLLLEDIVEMLVFHLPSGTLICTPCKTAITSLAGLRADLSHLHNSAATIGKDFINTIIQKHGIPPPHSMLSKQQAKAARPRCLDGKKRTASQMPYWNASNSVKHKNAALPEIPDLDFYYGYQCPEDDFLYCCATIETIRVHRSGDHKWKSSKSSVQRDTANPDFKLVRFQRLGNGTTCPYFPVCVKDQTRIVSSRTLAKKNCPEAVSSLSDAAALRIENTEAQPIVSNAVQSILRDNVDGPDISSGPLCAHK